MLEKMIRLICGENFKKTETRKRALSTQPCKMKYGDHSLHVVASNLEKLESKLKTVHWAPMSQYDPAEERHRLLLGNHAVPVACGRDLNGCALRVGDHTLR